MRLCKYKDSGVVLDITELTNKVSESLICLCCNSEVITRMGSVNIHHFAHKSKDECEYSKKSKSANSMSEFHIRLQNEYKSIGAELEVKMGNNIADCFLDDVVYEIQHSPIHIKKIQERTDNYLKHTGNELVWIIDNNTQKPENFLKENYVVCYYNESYSEIFYQGVNYPYSNNGISELTIDHIKECITDGIERNLKDEKEELERRKEYERLEQIEIDKWNSLSFKEKQSKRYYKSIYEKDLLNLVDECYDLTDWKYIGNYNHYKTFKNIITYYGKIKKDMVSEDTDRLDSHLKVIVKYFRRPIIKTYFPFSEGFVKNRTRLDLQLLMKILESENPQYITKVETANIKHRGKLVSELSDDYMRSLATHYLKKPDGYYTNLFYSYIKVNKML